MRNNKLIQIFKQFKKSDIKELEHFLSFLLLPAASSIHILFTHLKTYHPYRNEKKIMDEVLFNTIWNNEEYNRKRLLNLMGRLQKEVRVFLQYKELQKTETFQRFLYAQSPVVKNNQALFLNNSSKWMYALNAEKDSADRYYHLVKYHELNFYFAEKDTLNGISNHYDGVITNVDLYYISYKLQLYCENFSIQSLFGENISTSNLVVEDFLTNSSIDYQNKKHPLLHLYIKVAFFLKGEQAIEGLEEIFKLLKKYQPKIENHSVTEVFSLINNYGIRQRFKGITTFDKLLYKITAWIVTLGFFEERPFITADLYINIIYAAINVGNIHFAEKYKDDKVELVRKREREDAFLLAESICFCAKGEYTKAIESLEKIVDFSYKFRYRRQFLLLKNEFELFVLDMSGQERKLENRINSYNNFFAREKKMGNQRKESYLNFLRFIRKLKHFFLNIDKSAFFQLEKELNELSVINKPWLKEKLKQGADTTPFT